MLKRDIALNAAAAKHMRKQPVENERKKIGNRWHRLIPHDQIQPGDWITYWDHGQRMAKLAKFTRKGDVRTAVHKCKDRSLGTIPSKVIPFEVVVYGWTRRD